MKPGAICTLFCPFTSSFLLSNYKWEKQSSFLQRMGSQYWAEGTEGREFEVWLIETVSPLRHGHNRHQQNDKNYRGNLLDFGWPMMFLSLVCVTNPCRFVYCFPSECQTTYGIIPRVVYVCFYFRSKCILDIHPPTTEPFHKKARTGFKSYKLAKSMLAPLLQPLLPVSHSLSPHGITTWVLSHWAPAAVSTL